MSDDKRYALVKRIYDLTKRGLVDWEETVNPDEFIVTKGELSIMITKARPQNGGVLIVFNILDEDGEIIDEFDDESWGALEDNYNMCEELFSLARGYAKGTEQVLDRLLHYFPDPEEVPF